MGGAVGERVESRADLVRYFEDALKDRGPGWVPRVGVESELLPIDPLTGRAVPYSGEGGVEAALACLGARGFEDPGPGAAHTVRLTRGELSINLEPGAQTEVSGTPFASLGDVAAELGDAVKLMGSCARDFGFRFCGHGVQPVSLAHEIELVPKRRYDHMTRYFDARGGRFYKDMMRRTASVQASFDFADEQDAGRKLRLALLGAPVAAAIFANSPVTGGKPSGLQSERALIWTDVDRARQGTIRAALDGAWSFERYVDFALEVPAILARADDGGVEDAGGRTFAELLARGTPSGRPVTRTDWEIHLTTIFTDARLKRVVECRTCDATRPADAMAVPAFWTGLLYHRPATEAALELLRPRGAALEAARVEIARHALRARLDGGGSVL
ncbi:MAG TPA: glutamate-cysteine ligase family protein, partial [Planctomycetota bacterium]|nr:glutamate-cysteine ligase family protein [Planctomycetota bacterium]